MTAINWLSLALTALILGLVHGNDSNFLFNSDRYPERDLRPTLSNGNIGFVAHSDSVFLTGVYNGRGSQSHRARIPNYANLQLVVCSPLESSPPDCTYQLDIKFGRFRTMYKDPNGQFEVVHDVYPHRSFEHAIVNRFHIQRLGNPAGVIQTIIHQHFGAPSADITFETAQSVLIRDQTYWYRCGRTNEVEDPVLQPQGTEVCIYYSDFPSVLELPSDQSAQEFFIFTVFAGSRSQAERELNLMTLTNVEPSHADRMQSFWNIYGITVEGNDELDRAIKASAFQLFSNTPYIARTYKSYGISPSGLGRGGGIEEDFQGHNMWDLDLWIFPIILLFDPLVGRDLLEYRTNTIKAALPNNAAENGYEGWQFPWASAFTGREVSPLAESAEFRHHITGDVAFAARQYLLATNDLAWMQLEGCQLAYETAKFWKSRAVYNPSTDKYDIRSVTGPDYTHRNVTNNVFTNVVAAHNLFFGEFAGCMCRNILGLKESDWKELTKVARSLQLLYSEGADYHPQFEGYTPERQIGQADAVLVGYPLGLDMKASTKRNNLDIYGHATIQNGPAMTWSMHTIGWLELDELERAAVDLRKSYEPYMRAPFQVWQQNPEGYPGASNFVTGAGGFLQAIVYGYAGIRFELDQMVINKPRLPPGTNRLYIPEISYMRMKFSLQVLPDQFAIIFKTFVGKPSLRLTVDDTELEVCRQCGFAGKHRAVLKLLTVDAIFPECKLQRTTLNMKLADQTDGALANGVNPMVLGTLLVGYLLNSWL